MGLGAEDRERGSGGDLFKRQSGRALASGGGGGGGGRRTRRRTRQTEVGSRLGVVGDLSCWNRAGGAPWDKRSPSDRPPLAPPWRPQSGDTAVQDDKSKATRKARKGTIQACLKRTDLTCTMESWMSKRAPFPSPLFGTLSRDMPAASRYRHKMEGVRHRAVQQMPVSLGRTLSPPDWAESHLLSHLQRSRVAFYGKPAEITSWFQCWVGSRARVLKFLDILLN